MGTARVNLETGEILQRQKRFVKVMDEALAKIAKDKEIGALSVRVLLFLLSRMDYENVARLPQQDIVEGVGASRQKVSAALSALSASRYVTINTTKRPGLYHISEAIAQRGTKTVKA